MGSGAADTSRRLLPAPAVTSADTLRFDADEAHLLLNDRQLTGEQAASLCERTEGWAAGLVLAGLSLDRSDDHDRFVEAFQGNDRLVVDYLTEEYLAGVGETDRQRMLESAVLDQMTGPLIDAVCETSDGTRWLRELAATNQLVIGLDRTDTAFRYHHLLRDLLLLEAERDIPHRLTDLHLAAAHWHHEHGDTYRAIDHFISGDDLETAGDLIAIHANKLLNDGQIFTVLDLLERLGDLPERHSKSAGTKGWLNFSTRRFNAARHYYNTAAAHDHGSDANLIAALGIMVNLVEGDLNTALSIAATMSEPVESTQAIGLAAVHAWAGQFEQATRYIAIARELGASEPSVTWLAEAQRAVDSCPDPGIAGRFVDRVASRHGQTTRQPSQAGLAEELTDRELAVLRYLPPPMSQRDIVAELFVSLNTVKTRCRAIYRKLAVTDRKAAVQAARDAGLL